MKVVLNIKVLSWVVPHSKPLVQGEPTELVKCAVEKTRSAILFTNSAEIYWLSYCNWSSFTGLVIYFAFGKSQCYTVTLGSSIANIRSLSTKPDGLLHVVLFNAIIILCMQKFFEHCSQRPKTSVPITSNMMPRDCKIVNIDVSKKKLFYTTMELESVYHEFFPTTEKHQNLLGKWWSKVV